MKPQLSLTATHVIDLQDQPLAQHVLFVSDAGGGLDAFAVDGVDAGRFRVSGWRGDVLNKQVVVEVPAGMAWRLVARTSLETTTVQDVLTRRFEDEGAMAKLREKYEKPAEAPRPQPSVGHFL